MKYFEENRLDGAELIELHCQLTKACGALGNNLFFNQVEEVADTSEHREILARSAYMCIGVCEAVIARVPKEERERALGRVARKLRPVGDDEVDAAMDTLLKALFG